VKWSVQICANDEPILKAAGWCEDITSVVDKVAAYLDAYAETRAPRSLVPPVTVSDKPRLI
jgi:hypothetical protein